MKNKKLPYLFLTIALLLPVSVYASENSLKTETLPQIISWEDGHAYLENGELLRDGWDMIRSILLVSMCWQMKTGPFEKDWNPWRQMRGRIIQEPSFPLE